MLLIVAHHYVVHGLYQEVFAESLSLRSAFMLIFGAWGKTGINCFVLITGYFMCKSHITVKKFLKLVLEICFYSTVIYLIFVLTGYTPFSLQGFALSLCPFARADSHMFVHCYPIFYLFIPFLNYLVRNISKRTHFRLILASLMIFSVWASIPTFEVPNEYILWFSILYFIASYIRLYPEKIFDNTRLWGIATGVLFLLASASVICMTMLAGHFHKLGSSYYPYWFVHDSNKIFAVSLSVSAFLFFKSLKIKQSKFLNTVAASTFGVLLIHDGCGGPIHQFLWKDTLNNVGMYHSPYLVLHAIGSVLAIYIICTAIDYLRIRFLEKPFFKFYDKHWEKISGRLQAVGDKLWRKLNVKES